MNSSTSSPSTSSSGSRPSRRRRSRSGGQGAVPQQARPDAGRVTGPAAAGPRAGGSAPTGSAPTGSASSSIPATAQPLATTFDELGVPAALAESLRTRGITSPFPIQAATLPDTLVGRDVLGRGKTGSGKTLAFSLPMVARLAAAPTRRQPGRPRALVLAPTRELATQISATVEPLAAACGLTVTTIFGGVSQGRQVTALQRGVDIVVACPGRLEDLMGQGHVRLDAVEVTILDEADHMADLGFLPGVKRILDTTPAGVHRMLFSATLDNGVDVLVRRYLKDPVTHSVDSAESPVTQMTHHVLAVGSPADKGDVVRQLASGQGRRILFTRTKHAAKKLARQLTAAGIPAVDLHGNLSQPARERNLSAFSGGGVRVLVATDIAARGIHVDDIELVIHVDPPTEHKAYLHRSGRTARAGSGGTVVTVMLPEQSGDVRSLMRQAKITATHVSVRAGAEELTRLVGPVAPLVAPTEAVVPAPAPAAATRQGAPRTRSGRSGRSGRGGAASGGAASGGAAAPARRGGGGRGRGGGSAVTYSTSTPGSGGATRSRSVVDVSRAGMPRGGR